MKGYFGIGIYFPSKDVNIGTLFRSAYCFGASFVFTIGRKYEYQPGDTTKTTRQIPCLTYKDFDDMHSHLPMGCEIVCIENNEGAQPLKDFEHPKRCLYLLGNEVNGLPNFILEKHNSVVIPSNHCLNVSTSGSIVMYDRIVKN